MTDATTGDGGLPGEQHGRVLIADCGQQGSRKQKLVGEDVVFDLLPVGSILAGRIVVRARCSDAQQLLGMVPLIERARLVNAFVALQSHELA